MNTLVRVFIDRVDKQDFWVFVPECQCNIPSLKKLSFGATWGDISNMDQMELQHITTCEISILFGYGEEPEYTLALKYEKLCEKGELQNE